jgi:hypothetical protein
MKNLCILIVGQMRTNILSSEEITSEEITNYMKLNIFNEFLKNNFNYDVFVSSDSINIDRTKEFFGDNLKNICLTQKSWIDPNNSTPDFYLKQIDRKIQPVQYFLNLYDSYDLTNCDSYKYQVYQFYRALCCFNLVDDYTKYDYIMLIRPDLIYYNNFSRLFDFLEENKECKLIGNLNYYALGRPEIMKHYCELVYKFGSYNKNLKNYNIIENNICSPEFFNHPDTKRWSFAPEIQLACHLYEFCINNNLIINKTLVKAIVEPDVLMVRHWFIDRCNKQECYICYNNLCYEDILFKKFSKFIPIK